MSDQEMLELLAAQAPDPRPGHVEEVLVRARRARLRRQMTGWGAGFGVVAVSVMAAVVLAPSANGRQATTRPQASVGGGHNPTQPASASPDADKPPAAEAAAYAVAVKALAGRVRQDRPQWPIVYVMDHTCANVVTPAQGNCDAQALPASVRSDLIRALASYAPVHFVAGRAEVTDPNLDIINGGVLVTLGRIQIHGDQAQVPLSVQRGGLDGQGLTYRLTRQGETWQVKDTVGPAWIS